MAKLDLKDIHEWPFTLQLFVVLPVIAVIFYVAYIFDFSSLNKIIQDKKANRADLLQQVDMIFTQQHKLETELAQFSVYDTMMKEWQLKLVPPAKLPDLLNDILKIGTAKGLKFDSIQPGVEVKDDGYLKTPIKIVAQGGYHQFASFVSEISNLPSLIVAKNIAMTRPKVVETKGKNLSEQAAAKNILTIEMILEVYSQAPQQPLGEKPNDKK